MSKSTWAVGGILIAIVVVAVLAAVWNSKSTDVAANEADAQKTSHESEPMLPPGGLFTDDDPAAFLNGPETLARREPDGSLHKAPRQSPIAERTARAADSQPASDKVDFAEAEISASDSALRQTKPEAARNGDASVATATAAAGASRSPVPAPSTSALSSENANVGNVSSTTANTPSSSAAASAAKASDSQAAAAPLLNAYSDKPSIADSAPSSGGDAGGLPNIRTLNPMALGPASTDAKNAASDPANPTTPAAENATPAANTGNQQNAESPAPTELILPEPASILIWAVLAAIGLTVGWYRSRTIN